MSASSVCCVDVSIVIRGFMFLYGLILVCPSFTERYLFDERFRS